MAHPLRVLCVNAGSSSLKVAVYEVAAGRERCVVEGQVEGLGRSDGRLTLRGSEHAVDRAGSFTEMAEAAGAALDALGPATVASIQAVGHRVVHGGPRLDAPRIVDADLVAELRALVPLAPLHQPAALDALATVGEHLPDRPNVACFDTAFHRRLPELARRLPLPEWLWEAGVQRYGFHGLSFESVVSQLGVELASRTVIAHLGSGTSLVALQDGLPIDTTMGLTPTGGVVMGTRSGDLDPGVLLYLLREKRFDVEQLEHLVNEEAGLRGLSGTTSDMRTLLERRGRDRAADVAVSLFCRGVAKAVGSLAAVLDGLDHLVFTGSIGERSERIRHEILAQVGHLGVSGARGPTSAAGRGVRVVATNENRVIARHAHSLLVDG